MLAVVQYMCLVAPPVTLMMGAAPVAAASAAILTLALLLIARAVMTWRCLGAVEHAQQLLALTRELAAPRKRCASVCAASCL
jgi:hypothetical protein